MMGIRINGPTYVYRDNQSVLANTTGPDSALNKNLNSIAFYFVREGSASDEWRTTYIVSDKNTSDLLTKCPPSGDKRNNFNGNSLYHLYTAAVGV